MKPFTRTAWFITLTGIGLAFLFTAIGPNRMDPWLTRLLNIEGPAPIIPPPIEEAPNITQRVKEDIYEDDVQNIIQHFAAFQSRIPGYPGHDEARQFIESEFNRLGLQNVTTETFDVTTPIDRGGTLTLLETGEQIPIRAIWPNLVKTSTLPKKGIRTQLIDGRTGAFDAFNGKDIENAVVLMDFNTWNNWLNAAMLGAGQVLFIEPDSTFYSEAEQKFLEVPNSVERFWIDKKSGQHLRQILADRGSINIEIKARMDWVQSPAQNVLGWVEGSDPNMRNKPIVISAYYDAMSVVPALAPGAEMAGSIAGLLELVDYFSKYPPKHTVLFLATSGHHLGLRGISDFMRRHTRKEEHFAALVTDPIDIPLFIALDLTSQTNQVGVWHNTSSIYYKRFFTPIGKSFIRYAKALVPAFGLDPETAMIDGINPKSGTNWNMYIPGENVRAAGQAVIAAGTPALSLITINDARFRVDTPLDKPEYVNIANLTDQIRTIAGVLDLALNSRDLVPKYRRLDTDDTMRDLRVFAKTYPRRSITPDRSRPGTIIAVRGVPNSFPRTGANKSIKGMRLVYYAIADENGQADIPGLIDRRVNIHGFSLDPDTGDITYAPNRKRGYKDKHTMNWWRVEKNLIMFPCVATDFYDAVDPRYLNTLYQISIYGEGNVAPQEYGYAIGTGQDEPVGTVFTVPGQKIKIAMRSGSIGVRFLLLNSANAESKETARGDGFQIIYHGAFLRTSFQAAKDMWTLNEARMRELSDYAIENQRLKTLHAQAKDHLTLAENAQADKHWSAFVKHTRAALGIESRAYPDVKATQNDVIRGVIFFMLLVIPCAFFTERLIFTASDIRWQITGFGAVFVVIWYFLSQVHPAFQLSNPFVILLAFVILALSIFVISLVFSRFNDNLRQLRSIEVLKHDADVGRISASVASFQLGIANMKRRKLRTWLTFLTLVILTFTVLSFTSIKSALEFHQLHRDTPGTYPGVLIRSKFWGNLEESAYDYARINFQGLGIVAPRSWYMTKDKKMIPISHADQHTHALGVLGMTAAEPQVTGIDTLLTVGRWFHPNEYACILPQKLADLLGIQPHDVGRTTVQIFGKSLPLIGLINAEKLRTFYDLDEEILTPADFEETSSESVDEMTDTESRERQGLEQPEVDVAPFEHLDPEDMAVVPYDLLRGLGSPLKSVAVRFHEGVDVEARVKEYLTRLSVVLFAGVPDNDGNIRVSVYSSLGNTSLHGLANLFIPILIAALIVLNTMMGSVYERFREIGIYSSVGLAPVHIAFLFIAEACVYAVLGTVAGYLLGQGIAKVLLWQGWLEGFTLNYSAMSTVTSSMLVMLVVLLSSLYPARQASLMAVPDVTRRWELPDPDGDQWHFEFPFTVGGIDVFGLSVFLVDYLEAHTAESMGTFFTDATTFGAIDTPKGRGCVIDTVIWLAPFDLGVSQQIHFEVTPTGEFNIYTLTLTINRLSGDAASWQRVNRNFINTLRKQFLIWRTVDPADKTRYREKGERMLVGESALS